MSEKSNSRFLSLFVVLLVLVGGATLWWLFRPKGDPAGKGNGLSIQDRNRLSLLKNQSLAYLENQELDEAEGYLHELAKIMPDELFCVRNLAVLDVMRLGTGPQNNTHLNRKKAIESIQRLKPIDASEVPLLLEAKVAHHAEDVEQSLALLQKARELSPNDAAIAFEIYKSTQFAKTEERKKIRFRAIQEAYTLSPRNSILITRYLQEQSINEHPDFAKTLEQAEKILEPYAEGIKRYSPRKYDILEFIQNARDAHQKGNWKSAYGYVTNLFHITNSSPLGLSDRRLIARNLLEYAAFDFSEEFRSAHPLSRRIEEPISVSWKGTDSFPETDHIFDLQTADIDLDGHPDLCLLDKDKVRIFIQQNSAWEEVLLVDIPANFESFLFVDLDSDADGSKDADFFSRKKAEEQLIEFADLDLIIWGTGGVRVFRNIWDDQKRIRSFEEVEQPEEFQSLEDVQTVAVADADHDGDLDFLVASSTGLSLWANLGNFQWMNHFPASYLPAARAKFHQILPADWDSDVDLDFFLVGEAGTANGFLENLRHGLFRWRPLEELPEFTSASVLDVNHDGTWDLIASTKEGTFLYPSYPEEQQQLRLGTAQNISELSSSMIQTWDFDNDGYQDLLLSGPAGRHVLRSESDTLFSKIETPFSTEQPVNADESLIQIEDLDRDGDLDVVLTQTGLPTEMGTIYSNEGGNQNSWLEVQLQGQQVKSSESSASGRVNHYGIGSVLEVKYQTGYQKLLVNREVTHVGLGKQKQIDALRVLWTNGIPFNKIKPTSNQFITERQILKGSCPYLYAWNGEQFVFVTDCLWAAPIGLQFAEGVHATPREWEYLKIAKDQLHPKQSEYQIQITEELWEAAYFDQVELIAVDHPNEFDFATNEKVGPPSIANHKLHFYQNTKIPVRIVNQSGRDLLPELREADEIYGKSFEKKLRQGLAKEHFLEIDLGKCPEFQTMTLFLKGWIYPTDTSINIALSTNPDLPSPNPPSLWIPDENGIWQKTLPFTGFPGGKTKTIAMELKRELFSKNDFRARFVTNMEFYWDAVWFTLDEPQPDFHVQSLSLNGADLHYRGFSRISHQKHFAPDFYDYHDVSTTPHWPAMKGGFTRYGNVTELIEQGDDQLVIMGAGDEMTLRFQVPENDPPEGWVRQYLLHNIGWDKDADLNTVLGESVEPLPYRGIRNYPGDIPNEDVRKKIDHQLKTFHTRQQSSHRFWNALRK